jgi:hypothetical protein
MGVWWALYKSMTPDLDIVIVITTGAYGLRSQCLSNIENYIVPYVQNWFGSFGNGLKDYVNVRADY